MGGAVGIAQRLLQHDAVARVRLDREREQSAARQHLRGRCHHRPEVADIDEHVGRQDQMVARAGFRLCRQELRQVERPPADRRVPWRAPARSSPATDRRRPASRRGGRNAAPRKPGAAAEIEHVPMRGRSPVTAVTASSSSCGPTIVEPCKQRRSKSRAYWSNSRAHIAGGHRRRDLGGAKPRELQPRAVAILGVGLARLRATPRSPPARSPSVAHLAEREPGGGEAGRELHRLRVEIGGRRRGRRARRRSRANS